MATAMPWPWCGPSARIRRTSRSSVPWSRESRVGGSFLVDILPEYRARLVECQLESAGTTPDGVDGPLTSRAVTVRDDQGAEPDGHEKPTVHGPFGLASHEAPRKDVDSLKEPDASHEETQYAGGVQCDAHRGYVCCSSVNSRQPSRPSVGHSPPRTLSAAV